MRWFSRKPESSRDLPLTQLGEKDLAELYEVGKLKKVEAGQALFIEGAENRTFYLVISGQLQIEHAESSLTGTDSYQEGDWIGESTFFGAPGKVATVAATSPSVVLGLNEFTFNALDHRMQAFILRRLNDSALARSRRLMACCTELHDQIGYFKGLLKESMVTRGTGCEQSEIITGLFKKLPSLPVYVTRMIQLLTQESSSIREVTQLVKQDPTLAGEVLKTINSSYYSLQNKISDIQYAITYLGFNQVYQIVLTNGLRRAMPETKELKSVHEHSVILSHLVHAICQLHDRSMAPLLSTIALLHEIGKIVVLLLKRQNPRIAFLIEMLDCAKAGAMLLREWNIPDPICNAVEFQDYPAFLPPRELPKEHRESIALLFVAHAAFEFIGGDREGALPNPFLKQYLEFLNLPGGTMEDLIDKSVLIDLNLRINTYPLYVRNFLISRKYGM